MRNALWRLWLRWSKQTYPTFRGHTLRTPLGTVYTYAPEEMYRAWTRDGAFVNYGTWPPLVGKAQ